MCDAFVFCFLQPDPLQSPPQSSQTEIAEQELPTADSENQDRNLKPEEQSLEHSSDQPKASSNTKTDDRKHIYKMTFVKST